MVRGLDIFRSWFAEYADQYVLIGGTAASLTMEEAGLAFRATKDLDIFLHVEALPPAFVQAFWKFVESGGYEIRQSSETGKPIFYRFQKPADQRYSVMVELFARAPDGLPPAEGSQLTPIPLDEALSRGKLARWYWAAFRNGILKRCGGRCAIDRRPFLRVGDPELRPFGLLRAGRRTIREVRDAKPANCCLSSSHKADNRSTQKSVGRLMFAGRPKWSITIGSGMTATFQEAAICKKTFLYPHNCRCLVWKTNFTEANSTQHA